MLHGAKQGVSCGLNLTREVMLRRGRQKAQALALAPALSAFSSAYSTFSSSAALGFLARSALRQGM